MVLYSHIFQNFPQFIVIHTVKGFGIVSNAEEAEVERLYEDLQDLLELTLNLHGLQGDPTSLF